MKRRLGLVVLAVFFIPLDTPAQQGKDEQVKPSAASAPAPLPGDAIDLVYLGEVRPVRFRLHVQIDGRSAQSVWGDFMYSLFQHLDQDNDLVLTKEEAEQAPNPQQLRGGFFFPQPGVTAPFTEIDGNRDGKASLDELAAYYRRFGLGSIQITPGYNPTASGEAVTEALFKQLDQNKDGKLSRNETLKAEEVLRPLDQDDNEIITLQELIPNPYGYGYYQVAQAGGMQAPVNTSPFIVFPRGESPARAITPLLQHYDKNKNQKLSREECALDQDVFTQLDASKDGELDSEEIAKLLSLPPDVALICQLTVPQTGQVRAEPNRPSGPTVQVYAPVGKETAFGAAVKPSGSGVMINLTDAQLDLRPVPGQSNAYNYRQYYQQQFKAADTDNNGYLDQKEVMQPQFRVFQTLFQVGDRDKDGKLYEKELQVYLDLPAKAAACNTVLTLTNPGRGLFELFDKNRDGRLGQRVLRTAWERLAPLDRDGDQLISQQELPRQLQLMLSQGQPLYSGQYQRTVVVAQGGMAVGATPTPPAKGPLWFRKMDRNADGDVSLREFLGLADDFKRIDSDNDDLIDLAEAEKADKELRKEPTTANK